MSATATPSADPRLTVIEASAGTGKTHRITELVVEHVTRCGTPIERVLVVTFTRAATAELRDRIRRSLTQAAAGHGEGAERARSAVVAFDLATITTIHGFCHQVLGSLGLLGGAASDSITTDDLDLRSEVVNDAILREVAGRAGCSRLIDVFVPESADPAAKETDVRSMIRTMLTHPTADVVVEPGPPPTTGKQPLDPAVLDEWRSFMIGVRDDVLSRRSAAGVLTHDDVLRLAHDAVLGDPSRARAIADRFDLVLIDEFQDTDALQWQMFETIFLAPLPSPAVARRPRMVVVGDPKQAIYSFRGADVHAYLSARARADSTETLERSWRMEPGLLEAVNLLFRGATFGEPTVRHADLRSPDSAAHPGPSLTGDHLAAPLVVRAIEPTERKPKRHSEYVQIDKGRALVARDVASVVDELLAAGARIEHPERDPAPLAPRDIAVLVGRHSEADLVSKMLAERGIRSVRRSTATVMSSPAADQWRWLFTAIDRPSAPSAASLAAMSWFVGWGADELAAADADDRLSVVQEMLADWRRTLADGGIAGLLAELEAVHGLTERVLAQPDGERSITDLEHVAELLHDAVPGAATPSVLMDLLDELQADDEEATDHAARRIDSDDDAVQVLTIHAAKGLQFAVTLVPFLWTARAGKEERVLHDGDRLALDVTIGARDDTLKRLATDEALGTLQRLAYVALTRARHRTVVWWGRGHGVTGNPLTELLMARTGDAERVAPVGSTPDVKGDFALGWQRLEALGSASNGTIAITRAEPRAPRSRALQPSEQVLEVNTFSRRLDRRWRRHSFSAIAAPARHLRVEETEAADDELVGPDGEDLAAASPMNSPATTTPSPATLASSAFATSLRAPLLEVTLAGADFGTAVHTLMEHLDFAATDLGREIGRVLDERWPWASLPVPRELLASGVEAILVSPTGRQLAHQSLSRIGRADRLDELVFELPLATGGRPVQARDIGAVVLDHLDAADPFAEYASHVRGDAFDVELAGYLTGSIDLVARVRDGDGPPRFTVCDYKTNRLPAPGDGAPLDAYHPVRLPREMVNHHYPLQALLYSVALHRYLRWRLRGYEPSRHLGGAAYLFVRGMVGPETPVFDGNPAGVCGWDIPPALTVALSDLLDGRRP